MSNQPEQVVYTLVDASTYRLFRDNSGAKRIGQIDRTPEIYEHLKIGDKTFVVGVISHKERICGVTEIIEFDGDTEYTDEVVCPHCGHEQGDSFELSDDDGTDSCALCGREYRYVRNIEITYSTEKIGGDSA